MSFPRTLRSRRVAIENHFCFPPIGGKQVGDPICIWEEDHWTYLGHQEVGIYQADRLCAADPAVSIHKGSKGWKLTTKAGLTHYIPIENVTEKVVHDKKFIVAAYPTIISVHFDISKFLILGCFGYHYETESVCIFSPKDVNSSVYDVDFVNPDAIFSIYDDSSSSNPEFRAAPAYSPAVVIEPLKEPKILSDLKKVKAERFELESSDGDSEEISAQELRVKKLKEEEERLRKSVRDLLGPGNAPEIIQVVVKGNQLKKIERRRESLEKHAKELEDARFSQEYVKKILAESNILKNVPPGVVPMPYFPKAPPRETLVSIMPEAKKAKPRLSSESEMSEKELDEQLL